MGGNSRSLGTVKRRGPWNLIGRAVFPRFMGNKRAGKEEEKGGNGTVPVFPQSEALPYYLE